MKKLLSLILVLCMLFSMSITAFATEGETDTVEVEPVVVESKVDSGSIDYVADDKLGALQNAVYEACQDKANAPVEVDPAKREDGNVVLDSNNGSVIPADLGGAVIVQDITIDLNGNNVMISKPSVGSDGTETQGLQLLKQGDNNKSPIEIIGDGGSITFNGENNSALKMGIQNYTDLVLDGVTINGTKLADDGVNYVVSNNSGSLTVQDGASIIAADGDVAFDVYVWADAYKDAPNVTIEDGARIQGTVEFDGRGTADQIEAVIKNEEEPLLSIEGGFFSNFLLRIGDAVADYAEQCISITGGLFDKVDDVVVDSNNQVIEGYQLSNFLEDGLEFHYVKENGKEFYVVRVKPATPSEPPVVVVVPVEPEYVPVAAPAPQPAAPAPVVVAPAAPVAVEVNGATVELAVVAEDIKAEAVAPVAEGKAAELKVTVAPAALAVEGAKAEEVVEALVATATVSVKDGAALTAQDFQISMNADGELKIELSAEYLKTLGAGEHVIVLNIGGILVEFTIVIE